MRVAVFSDVHGNLTALQAVLAHLEANGPFDHIIFAGDLCLFGPRPAECIRALRRPDIISLVGNTDLVISEALAPPADYEAPSEERYPGLARWTAEQLGVEAGRWLRELSERERWRASPTGQPADDLLVTHANPQDVHQVIFPAEARQRELYGRVRQPDAELAPLLARLDAAALAFGHLHIPNRRFWQGKLLANISSVSLPGDGDPRAKYGVLTRAAGGRGWAAETRRVPFEAAEEMAALEAARPPGWEEQLRQWRELGCVPQRV
ncbi:MAG: metallophosphoesterase family protein [Candidatus Promineifilaceae bacterium]